MASSVRGRKTTLVNGFSSISTAAFLRFLFFITLSGFDLVPYWRTQAASCMTIRQEFSETY